jgi:hypothetical protein
VALVGKSATPRLAELASRRLAERIRRIPMDTNCGDSLAVRLAAASDRETKAEIL